MRISRWRSVTAATCWKPGASSSPIPPPLCATTPRSASAISAAKPEAGAVERLVAAQYVVTFLQPEMLHVYRQITSLRAWHPALFCQRREGEREFPFDDVTVLGKARTHQLRRFWQKTVRGGP